MTDYIDAPDVRDHRVGRCNNKAAHGGRRPLFAWEAKSGLRLLDARCPDCGMPLDATSRMAHGAFRAIAGDGLLDQLKTAAGRYYDAKLTYLSNAVGFDAEGKEYAAELARDYAKKAGREHEKVAKALHRAYAATL